MGKNYKVDVKIYFNISIKQMAASKINSHKSSKLDISDNVSATLQKLLLQYFKIPAKPIQALI